MNYKIIRLIDRPELKEEAAKWFHEKWGIPLEAYAESMEECLAKKNPVPQWYVAMEGNRIIGGLGVIKMIFMTGKTLLQMFVRFLWLRIGAAMEWQAPC